VSELEGSKSALSGVSTQPSLHNLSSESKGWAPNTSTRISLAVSSSWRLGFTAGLGALSLCLSHQDYLMRRPSRWSGLPAPPGCFSPCSAQLPACHRSRRPGYCELVHGFQLPVQYGGVKEDGRLPCDLSAALAHMQAEIVPASGSHDSSLYYDRYL